MKQYNFEDQLERKLNERVIAPSPDAWERVAYNRQQQQKRRKKNPLWYLIPVAAVLCIGAFLVLSNSNTPSVNKNRIVVREQKQDAEPKIHQQVIIDLPTETAVAARSETMSVNTTHIPANSIHQEIEKEIANPTNTLPYQQDIELQKANEVAVAISEIIKKDGPVTDDMIDSLLLKAQREIALERIEKDNKGTDEAALLKEAETQVEKSFRDKVYDVFNHKFRTIKIAIKQ